MKSESNQLERQQTVKDKIAELIKSDFVAITDKETFEKELSFAIQHFARNPQLQKATFESKVQAVLNVAQTGLSLNPVLKYAYLVPRSVRKGSEWVIECHLEPSYVGLCKLITDTGSAKSIAAHLVYEGDQFEVSLGTSTSILHKPAFENDNITKVYMVATLSDGSKMVEVMRMDQIADIRERSESFKAYKAGKIKTCIWESDLGEMARKTVVRRGIKYLPKTDIWDKLGAAIRLDEVDYMASAEQINTIETLLLSAAITPEEQENLFRETPTMSASRAREIIAYLDQNQVDAITAGRPYSQTDIIKKVNEHK